MRRTFPLACVLLHAVSSPAQDWHLDLPRTLLRKHSLESIYEQYVQSVQRYVKAFRVQALPELTKQLFADPLRAPEEGLRLTDDLAKAAFGKELDLASLLIRTTHLLEPVEAREFATGDDLDRLLGRETPWRERLALGIDRIERAHQRIQLHLDRYSIEERTQLRASLEGVLRTFQENVYITKDKQRAAEVQSFLALSMTPFLEAAILLAPLADEDFARGLRRDLRKDPPSSAEIPGDVPGVRGTLLYAQETSAGTLVIGGPRSNHYEGTFAFIFDVGGEDHYQAASTRADLGTPVNMVLDLSGNDHYEANGDFAQGCGVLGVSFLVDHAGRDTYRAGTFAQGFGALGIGCLIDRRGEDQYAARTYAQGAGGFGLGLLVDLRGNDTMEAHMAAQAFAVPRSVGLLADAKGNDLRIATGKVPSTYGTKGKWNGQSQGAAYGMRTLDYENFHVAGGFGILIDGAGDDRSQVGEFGYGIGYYFGTGIVRDMGGDDVIEASRYGIATGAHNGIGLVYDDSGNDRYVNPHTASLAGNWDLNLSFLLDRRGNDHYSGAGITLGSSTITSLALFLDANGKDTYVVSGGQCFAAAGHPQDATRKTRSLAFFLDLGRDRDHYPENSPLDPKPSNGLECVRRVSHPGKDSRVETGVGVFLDR